MPDPQREDHTVCDECGKQFGGRGVIYHFSQLKYVEPSFWNELKEAQWQCPNGHKIEPPAIKKPPQS